MKGLWLLSKEIGIDEGGFGFKDGFGSVDCDIEEDVASRYDDAIGGEPQKIGKGRLFDFSA